MTQPSDTPTDHGRQFYCPVHQSSWCRCPVGSGETLEEPLVASHPPPTPEKCDHKFIDSPHCLKCGWVPPTPEEDAITDGEIRRRMKANAADPPAADPGGPMSTDKAPLPEAVREQIDRAVRAVIDLEAEALGDNCLAMQLRPLIAPVAEAAAQQERARLDKLLTDWREHARRVRPLESARLTAEKRARTAEWMFYTNRANELEAELAASHQPPTPREYEPHEICQSCGVVRPCCVHDRTSPTPEDR